MLKEDILEMRTELTRKEELLRKHGEKLNDWKEKLKDVKEITGVKEGQNVRPMGERTRERQ